MAACGPEEILSPGFLIYAGVTRVIADPLAYAQEFAASERFEEDLTGVKSSESIPEVEVSFEPQDADQPRDSHIPREPIQVDLDALCWFLTFGRFRSR